MIEAGTINFIDKATKESALAIVQYDTDSISLCLSHMRGGDIDILITREDAAKLIKVLNAALHHSLDELLDT